MVHGCESKRKMGVFLVCLTKCDTSSPDDGQRPEDPRPQNHSFSATVKTDVAKDGSEQKMCLLASLHFSIDHLASLLKFIRLTDALN